MMTEEAMAKKAARRLVRMSVERENPLLAESTRAGGSVESIKGGAFEAWAVNPIRVIETAAGVEAEDSNSMLPDCLTCRRP